MQKTEIQPVNKPEGRDSKETFNNKIKDTSFFIAQDFLCGSVLLS